MFTMNKLNLFKALLILQTAVILIYTFFTIQNNGVDLFSVMLSNIVAVSWSGQFNIDFSCYLLLSALWIMWRDQFSIKSIVTGLTAMILGIVFFAPYVLYLLTIEKGNISKVVIGIR